MATYKLHLFVYIFLFNLFFLPPIVSHSQTNINGGVVSGTWNISGSPYMVTGAIMIANGTNLTIEPGVKVEFQGSYKFLVLGQIIAQGTSTDSITFTASDTSQGWLGVRFDSTQSSNDTSRFQYCIFEYGRANGNASIVSGGVLNFSYYSKVIISNSRISNCYAQQNGGGINCQFSNPIITGNVFSSNECVSTGGAIFLGHSSPRIFNNYFLGNNVSNPVGRGGGIGSYGNSSALIFNNTFESNTTFRGAAIFISGSNNSPEISENNFTNNIATICSGVCCEFSSPTIKDNIFENNTGTAIYCEGETPLVKSNSILTNSGRAIVCSANTTATITENIIMNGTGGGINGYNSSVNINNNFISNNFINGYGGGIALFGSGTSTIYNNIIVNNSATSFGGGIYLKINNSEIINNTIINNTANLGGGLYCDSSSSPNIYNTAVWGNTATIGNQVYLNDEGSDPNVFYSNFEGGASNFGVNSNAFYLGSYVNNIDFDPKFTAPTLGVGYGFNSTLSDWTLQAISPNIDAGNPFGIYTGTDILGNPRVFNNIIDIGAVEFFITSATEYIKKLHFNIYPNPSTHDVNITFALKEEKEIKIELFNSLGQIVKTISEQKFTVGENKIVFPIENLTKGIYHIKFSVDENVVTKKLVKMQSKPR